MLATINEKLLAYAGLIVGILGMLLSIYFYIATQEERKPTFLLDYASRAVILSNNDVSESTLMVTRRDGKPINSDINIAKFYFWNDGRIPIKKDNILKPIYISLEEGNEILSYKAITHTREVVHEQLDFIDTRNLMISFNILEKGDGISGQIIYSGDKKAHFKVSGVIEGVGEIEFCTCVASKFGKTFWLTIVLYVLLIILLVISWRLIMKQESISTKIKFFSIVVSVLLHISAGIYLYQKHLKPIFSFGGEPPSLLTSISTN